MLLNRKEEVHHIIEGVAQAPDVEGVRVYDKNGTIVFSTDSTEIGAGVDAGGGLRHLPRQGTPLRRCPTATACASSGTPTGGSWG